MFSLREWAGLLFKQAREDLGYSQQFVADELEIDIRTIKRLEAGNGNPDFRTLCNLFHLLHVSPVLESDGNTGYFVPCRTDRNRARNGPGFPATS